MGMLKQEMTRLAKQAGGSHKTVHDRIKLAQRFCQRLVVAQNVQIRYVRHLKARDIEGYIRERLAQGITKRTLHNETAMLRVIHRQAGRDKLADSERISNRALGLAVASRNGAKRAITPEYYYQALETARTKDAGLAAAMELARLMGLRSEEVVQCAQSLKTWQQALARGDTRLTVVFGTKGNRPRETLIQDTEAVKKALDNALSVAEQRHDRLIDKPDLKSAMKYWSNHMARIGLTGVFSPHSLRYAWAQDDIRHYLAQGFSEKEALTMTAMDLGHGDGRGRWVVQVYGRREDAD
ncbi:integrase domain-containing protein [Klebsiella quasipneumoniae]|uniref:integrase domain-containing protein n=1 Tax=Klebsiella quasipneumoniae TaxID=1463165 RepID=UPI000CFD3F26|nr:integrase domain-containing protein [Klebsiella quasipneumoniae]MCQ3895333.1 integrase domain-containing protein [Klebsiella quasipneumoniae]MDD9213640.1 integrase domain-containing protein [Klebsiella quasipneumoniae]PQM79209.1 DNA-binding protein [Klebsiella quasipneumoniae]PQM89675.1 DNA-binding protein [Klebsiella quasipneumoniae]